MCGRYYLYVSLEKLMERYDINNTEINFTPKKEIFPSEKAPVVIKNKTRQLKKYRWGFNTSFSRGLIINARGESVSEKPIFKNAFKKNRCLIPVTGFFEWKHVENKKIKYKIKLCNENIFSLAAIYETFTNNEEKPVTSFAIITTSASKSLKPIHSRMPVILNKETEIQWLNKSEDLKSLQQLLIPYNDNKIYLQEDNGQMKFQFD